MGSSVFLYRFIDENESGVLEAKDYEHKADIPYVAIGFNFNKFHREELRGRPVFRGFCGPMWGGITDDGRPIIRYESVKAYEILSQ